MPLAAMKRGPERHTTKPAPVKRGPERHTTKPAPVKRAPPAPDRGAAGGARLGHDRLQTSFAVR